MKKKILQLLSLSSLLLGLNSCVVPVGPGYSGYPQGGGYAPSRTVEYDDGPSYRRETVYTESYEPDYREDDFYYCDGRPSPYYSGYRNFSIGFSYYHGSGVCPICHHSPCRGHGGRPSTFVHHGHRDSHMVHHDDRDAHRGYYPSTHGNTKDQHSHAYQPKPQGRPSLPTPGRPSLPTPGNHFGRPQGPPVKDPFAGRAFDPSHPKVAGTKPTTKKKKDDDDRDHHH